MDLICIVQSNQNKCDIYIKIMVKFFVKFIHIDLFAVPIVLEIPNAFSKWRAIVFSKRG